MGAFTRGHVPPQPPTPPPQSWRKPQEGVWGCWVNNKYPDTGLDRVCSAPEPFRLEEHGLAHSGLLFSSLQGLLCSLRVCVHAPVWCGASEALVLGQGGAVPPRNVPRVPGWAVGLAAGLAVPPVLGEGRHSLRHWLQFPKPEGICFDSQTASCLPSLIQRKSRLGLSRRWSLSCGKEEAALALSLMSSQSGEGDKRGNK